MIYSRSWTEIFPALDGNNMVCHVIYSEKANIKSGDIVRTKYSRPWTELIPALDGNIIGLDEAGTEPDFQSGNISGHERNSIRPRTEISSSKSGCWACKSWETLGK